MPRQKKMKEYHFVDGPKLNLKFDPDVAKILKKWYEIHQDYPYPTRREKETLIEKTGLTIVQVNSWFSNERRKKRNSVESESSGSDVPSENQQKPYDSKVDHLLICGCEKIVFWLY
jgi:hypothetical protein